MSLPSRARALAVLGGLTLAASSLAVPVGSDAAGRTRLSLSLVPPPAGWNSLSFTGVNDHGKAVGDTWRAGPDGQADFASYRGLVHDCRSTRLLRLPPWATSGSAYGISRSGLILGSVEAYDPNEDGYFLFSPGLWRGRRLLRFTGMEGDGPYISPRGLNDRGVVCGADLNQQMAVLCYKKSIRYVDPFPGHNASTLRRINNRGQAVGSSYIAPSTPEEDITESRAFLWQDGTVTRLPEWPGARESAAMAINEHGLIAGRMVDARGVEHAVLWRGPWMDCLAGRLYRTPQIIDLGGPEPGNTDSVAFELNDRGQVLIQTGRWVGDQYRASQILYKHGRRIDVSALARATGRVEAITLNDISNTGEMVGASLRFAAGSNARSEAGLRVRLRE